MKFKSTLLALCALGFASVNASASVNALSASMAPIAPEPQPTVKHWIFGGEFGYAEGGSDDNVFAANSVSPVTQFTTGQVDGASFGAFFGYDNGHNNDVMASWLHLDDSSGNKNVPANAGNPIVTTRGITNFGAATTANGRQKIEMNWLQFTFGHTFRNANHTQIHVRGGFDVMDFEHKLWTNTVDTTDVANNHWANFHSDFEGGGLVAGVDYLQDCWQGIQFFTKATVGLNYGELDSKVRSERFISGLGSQGLVVTTTQTKDTVIPLVAGEIGIGYGQNFWNVQAGVRGLAQFDVVQQAKTIASNELERSHYMQADVFGRITFTADV